MQLLHVLPDQAVRLDTLPSAAHHHGFYWLDAQHEEVAGDAEVLRHGVLALTGTRLYDLHLQDALNAQHPSFFDSTSDYDMLIFRRLAIGEHEPLAELDTPRKPGQRLPRLQPIVTRPVTFFVFERLLVTVSHANSRTIGQVRQRMLEFRARTSVGSAARNGSEPGLTRLPNRPEELLLRLVSGMVDRYLDLRQPLTDRLDRWQRELLDPRRPFSDWSTLLDARIELRRLENLCEEQHDALQELRDAYLETTPEVQQSDAYLVRIADVIEHIGRVRTHARRLEGSIETAVQLHFSATSHRTNQIVRALTVITAIFAPLTLITGLWGMNVENIPLARTPHAFALIVSGMGLIALVLLTFFWALRFVSDEPSRLRRWWRVLWRQRRGSTSSG